MVRWWPVRARWRPTLGRDRGADHVVVSCRTSSRLARAAPGSGSSCATRPAVERNRFTKFTAATKSIDSEAKSRRRAGRKGHAANLTTESADFLIGAYRQRWRIEVSLRRTTNRYHHLDRTHLMTAPASRAYPCSRLPGRYIACCAQNSQRELSCMVGRASTHHTPVGRSPASSVRLTLGPRLRLGFVDGSDRHCDRPALITDRETVNKSGSSNPVVRMSEVGGDPGRINAYRTLMDRPRFR
jgi:hypothetical protein